MSTRVTVGRGRSGSGSGRSQQKRSSVSGGFLNFQQISDSELMNPYDVGNNSTVPRETEKEEAKCELNGSDGVVDQNGDAIVHVPEAATVVERVIEIEKEDGVAKEKSDDFTFG